MRCAALLLVLCSFCAGTSWGAEPVNGTYIATAYAQHLLTASGLTVHRHVVAADPDILPIGSRIKIKHAGRYSGEYVVADTGDKIQGRKLDIYMPSAKVCMKFGSKPVRVRVIELGDGTHASAKQADQAVKQDVAQDVAKKVVGNAATEDDWAAKGKAAGTPASAGGTNGAGANGIGAKATGANSTGANSTGANSTGANATGGNARGS